MAITQIIATLPAVLNDSETFYEDIAIRNNSLVTVSFPSINTWATQANALAVEVNDKAAQVAAQAVDGGYSQTYINTNFVGVNNAQTIAGIKTFSANPISSAAQSSSVNALTRRDFVTTLDAQNIKLSGNQTITGVKTFSSNPISSDVQSTLTNALTRKDYVDGKTGAASETVTGVIELATTAEAQAGTDDLRALTPLKLRNALNASGTAPIYACRAWVNFNGTGTVAIRASGNVSSITDNGTGDYTVNFITAMPDADYIVLMNIGDGTYSNRNILNDQTQTAVSQTIYSVKVISDGNAETYLDPSLFYVAIFR